MVAIDEAAMRLGATDSEAYLEGWRQSEWEERDGSPEQVAQAVADELEKEFAESRIQEMLDAYGS
jgi:phytoene/squalene synthetase